MAAASWSWSQRRTTPSVHCQSSLGSSSLRTTLPLTLENDGDKIELEFPFSAPNLPSAVSMTKFRIIGLEETASSCQSILEPSFNNQVTTTSDLDMICIMYPTIITK